MGTDGDGPDDGNRDPASPPRPSRRRLLKRDRAEGIPTVTSGGGPRSVGTGPAPSQGALQSGVKRRKRRLALVPMGGRWREVPASSPPRGLPRPPLQGRQAAEERSREQEHQGATGL